MPALPPLPLLACPRPCSPSRPAHSPPCAWAAYLCSSVALLPSALSTSWSFYRSSSVRQPVIATCLMHHRSRRPMPLSDATHAFDGPHFRLDASPSTPHSFASPPLSLQSS
eukprot:1940865-Alexandrium_andersonii.AAC.1